MTNDIIDSGISFDEEGKLVSAKFNDFYFSPQGGLDESRHVFVCGNHLHERFREGGNFTILEAGFGTGLNFLATLEAWHANASSDQQLIYHSIELYPLPAPTMQKIHQHWPELAPFSSALLKQYSPDHSQTIELAEYNVTLILHFGDISQTLPKIEDKIDAWYLDGFAPDRNPQMWSEQVFANIKRLSKESATIATYSCARAVRENLSNIGFTPEKTPGFGNKRHMLQATTPSESVID